MADNADFADEIVALKKEEEEAARTVEKAQKAREKRIAEAKAEAQQIVEAAERKAVELKQKRTEEAKRLLEQQAQQIIAAAEREAGPIKAKRVSSAKARELAEFVLRIEG